MYIVLILPGNRVLSMLYNNIIYSRYSVRNFKFEGLDSSLISATVPFHGSVWSVQFTVEIEVYNNTSLTSFSTALCRTINRLDSYIQEVIIFQCTRSIIQIRLVVILFQHYKIIQHNIVASNNNCLLCFRILYYNMRVFTIWLLEINYLCPILSIHLFTVA